MHAAGTDVTESSKRFRYLTNLSSKLFLFIRVPLVRWSSLRDNPLSYDFLENSNTYVASRSALLSNTSWLRITSFLSLLFSRGP